MKLSLRAVGDIHVLSVSELATAENLKVLQAGVTKSLKTGKNRIILELAEAAAIPAEVLRELARLKLLANELSGDILLAGLDEQAKKNVENFSKPPFISCFATTEQAVQYFKQALEKKEAPAVAAPAPPAPAAAPVSAGTTASGDKDPFKEQIRQRELGEMGALRKENERLKVENKTLNELLATKLLDRRDPPDVQAYQEKLQLLENQLAQILEKPPEKKA